MTEAFEPLSYIPLEPATTFDRPTVPPELVHLDSPALDVFTDFRVVKPVTVAPYVPIDAALEMMKSAGVRLLLVTNADEKVLGIITASDIMGEEPINLIHEVRIKRSEISVEMIMTPRSDIRVLNMLSVEGAQVGHIVETLHRLEREHILVVEVDDITKKQRLRGLFSTSQIRKQHAIENLEEVPPAHSLAEMVHEIGE